jgi:hypothetical protein
MVAEETNKRLVMYDHPLSAHLHLFVSIDVLFTLHVNTRCIHVQCDLV